MKKIEFCFPGFTFKAMSFTIDDGNLKLDKKFIDVLNGSGIKGSFNLVGTDMRAGMTDDEYRAFYDGFEVTNHCKLHPILITDEERSRITDQPFDPKTASSELLYKTEREGVYHRAFGTYWGKAATEDAYVSLIDESKAELDEVFGKKNVCAFVWPYCEQPSDKIKKHLKDVGYASVRRTGIVGFELPSDRMSWSYNANHANLLARAEEFEAIPDDGRLRFFCFGVHSHDFENNNCWNVLEAFAEKYGNRSEDFWYATVREIFEYEDAVRAAVITDGTVTNASNRPIYLRTEGRYVILLAGESIKI